MPSCASKLSIVFCNDLFFPISLMTFCVLSVILHPFILGVPFKTQLSNSHLLGTDIKSEESSPICNIILQPPP